MHRSIVTVGAQNAQRLYNADGRDIVWAVIGSGIDAGHPHFALHKNLELDGPLEHKDFTFPSDKKDSPLTDEHGSGTKDAGVIAGAIANSKKTIVAVERVRDESGEVAYNKTNLDAISGMAPQCKLLSLKTNDDEGNGSVAGVIAALNYIANLNAGGRRQLVHGVHIGLAYHFDPEWFACGLSPLCVEVNRLVRQGVVVVAPSGNTGFGYGNDYFQGPMQQAFVSTIMDPGNAEAAITVGSTHRDLPNEYGVSYFSGKGPTWDGRNKPDLVAPGEMIVSCATGLQKKELLKNLGLKNIAYSTQSSTSLAAAHVSGLAAAFLSARRNFIGKPEMVKEIFMKTATDLGRNITYQGKGLVNLQAALQFNPFNPDPIPKSTASFGPMENGMVSRHSSRTAENAVSPFPNKRPTRLMCSYSHKDLVYWEELNLHLSPLKREGLIEIWFDKHIQGGEEWKEEIDANLDSSDIILLLVSHYFVASDYCYDVELKKAMGRHHSGKARVVPVIVSPADWSNTPFAKLQAFPNEGRPVTAWKDQHEAWADVAKGIRKIVEEMRKR